LFEEYAFVSWQEQQMTDQHSFDNQASTQVSRVINAPRKAVYQAFLDPNALATWLPPETMTGEMHTFEPRVGGIIRMSLIYQHPDENSPAGGGGKTSSDTDTFEGKFVDLIPDEKIVWVTQFESPDPKFAGEMTIIWSLADTEGGTEVTVRCENIPSGIDPRDNETGSQQSLQKLAALLED
jgi:uncharacterized protein YndB with AHSA1/START domain